MQAHHGPLQQHEEQGTAAANVQQLSADPAADVAVGHEAATASAPPSLSAIDSREAVVDNLLQLPTSMLCLIAAHVTPYGLLRRTCRALRDAHDGALEVLDLHSNARALGLLARSNPAQRMPRLRGVQLRIQSTVSVSSLTCLTHLNSLDLGAQDRSDLHMLTALTQLTKLGLAVSRHGNNDVAWQAVAPALTALQHLELHGCIPDAHTLCIITGLTALTCLSFRTRSQAVLPPLTALTRLYRLSLEALRAEPPALPPCITQLEVMCPAVTADELACIAAVTALQDLQLVILHAPEQVWRGTQLISQLNSLTRLTALSICPAPLTPVTSLPHLSATSLSLVPASLDQVYGPSQLHLVTAMRSLTSLSVSGHSRARLTEGDLSDMLRCVCAVTALETFHLLCTRVAAGAQLDVSQLGRLSQLTQLHLLLSCRLHNTQQLSSLTGLTDLALHADIPLAHLSQLPALTKLDVYPSEPAEVPDLAPLSALTALEHLKLGHESPQGSTTPPSDLSPLAGLTRLQFLRLPHIAPILSLQQLAGLKRLTQLVISGAQPQPLPSAPVSPDSPPADAGAQQATLAPQQQQRLPDQQQQGGPEQGHVQQGLSGDPQQQGHRQSHELGGAAPPLCDFSHISLLTSLHTLHIEELRNTLPCSHFTTLSLLQHLHLQYPRDRHSPVCLSDILQLSCLTRLTGLNLGGAEVAPADARRLAASLPRLVTGVQCGTVV